MCSHRLINKCKQNTNAQYFPRYWHNYCIICLLTKLKLHPKISVPQSQVCNAMWYASHSPNAKISHQIRPKKTGKPAHTETFQYVRSAGLRASHGTPQIAIQPIRRVLPLTKARGHAMCIVLSLHHAPNTHTIKRQHAQYKIINNVLPQQPSAHRKQLLRNIYKYSTILLLL